MRRHPVIAMGLSVVAPGLGQLYTGDRAKGVAILCIAIGILSGILWTTVGPAAFRYWLTPLMLAAVYPFVLIPAAVDAYQQASGTAKPLLAGGHPLYVIFMLLTVGPGAIPLLWQSPRFSLGAKIAWTAFVVLVALGGIMLVTMVGPAVERWFRQISDTMNAFQ